MLTIQNFHQNEFLNRSFSVTFIALIPKKHGVEELKDFRPISIIGGVYKIISKIYHGEFEECYGNFTVEHQMTFIKGWTDHGCNTLRIGEL